jgi:hypothetical protein
MSEADPRGLWERNVAVYAALKAGGDPNEVAARFGVTRDRVRQIWRRMAVPRIVWGADGVGRVGDRVVGRVRRSELRDRRRQWEGLLLVEPGGAFTARTERSAKSKVQKAWGGAHLSNEGYPWAPKTRRMGNKP